MYFVDSLNHLRSIYFDIWHSRDSSVSILSRLCTGRPGFDSWQEQDTFLFSPQCP